MYKYENVGITVICGKCGRFCRVDPPKPGELWPTYHTEDVCPECGATAWVAHDIHRDWKTGRLID